MEDIISVEHLAFSYPALEGQTGVPVFEDLNLTIRQGSFVAVLGTNGCGKSTLAKHFNSILLPTGGKVYVDGIDTSDLGRIMEVRRCVGMVFQNPDNQIVANVVEEDVAFAPENLGVPSAEIRKRVDDAFHLPQSGGLLPSPLLRRVGEGEFFCFYHGCHTIYLISLLRSFYSLIHRPVAPQGSAIPLSLHGRPSSSQVTLPPRSLPMSICKI